MNVHVIFTFNLAEEGFNGVGSIKTDIYYRLGWLWFAATLIKRNGHGITARPARQHSKTNQRLALEFLFPSCPLMDRQIHSPGSFD